MYIPGVIDVAVGFATENLIRMAFFLKSVPSYEASKAAVMKFYESYRRPLKVTLPL